MVSINNIFGKVEVITSKILRSLPWLGWLKHTYKTKDRVTRTPLKTGGELRCSGRVGSSCSTSGTRRVNLVTNSVISREWGKDREVFTTSGRFYQVFSGVHVKFSFNQIFSGVHVKFRFYQVFSEIHVKSRFYQVFSGVHVKFKFYQVFSGVKTW
jgi:hypothetical protein